MWKKAEKQSDKLRGKIKNKKKNKKILKNVKQGRKFIMVQHGGKNLEEGKLLSWSKVHRI